MIWLFLFSNVKFLIISDFKSFKNNISTTCVDCCCLMEAHFVQRDKKGPEKREPLGPASLIYDEHQIAKVDAVE